LTIDWTGVPLESSLVFFDDHQNAYDRLKTLRWFGFRHAMFEDNYPPGHGDCYSLKKAFAGSGFTPKPPASLLGKLAQFRGRDPGTVLPNSVDGKYLRTHLNVYCELPPIFKSSTTRWGDPWDDRYPTPAPLLDQVDHEFQRTFQEEAPQYTWICYVELS
jgi:hypothetical protein